MEGRLQLKGGFGFVLSENPEKPDVYVTGPSLLQAMDGDRVLARIIPGRRREGVLVKVVQRARSTAVGVLQKLKGRLVVLPEETTASPIYVLSHNNLSAQEGQLVVLRMTQWPHAQQQAGGILQEVLGWPKDAGADVRALLRKREISETFPPDVLSESASMPHSVKPSTWERRKTFFHTPVFTIDGEDAKDFDDALSLEKGPSGLWRVGVHIADVAEYVSLGSVLDKEAAARGTSVYPVGEVIPMLPKNLSENLCSLKPNVERLTLSCLMEMDRQGTIKNYEIVESVIRSARRFTYEEVQQILDQPILGKDTIGQTLQELNSLAKTLRANRFRRGALDLEFPESKVILDPFGKPVDIVRVEPLDSHKLIEEFMLLANETVATHLTRNHLPGLYRIHEKPDKTKLHKLVGVLKIFGIPIPASFAEGSHKVLGEVLRSLKGKPHQHVLGRLILRTLKQAIYSEKNVGHYGLASDCYTHFTSPIRRYPDLCVHRILKGWLHGRISSQQTLKTWTQTLPQVARHSSVRERLAQETEWDILDLKKAQYMKERLGETFSAIISSVTSFGFFVELTEVQVEGLVHVESLKDDAYTFDETRLTLYGRRTHKSFRPGQSVTVLLANVNETKRQLDFQLVRKKQL